MSTSKGLTILFLSANPTGTSQLLLAQEVRDINEGLLRSQNRSRLKLEQRWAVRHRDAQRALLDFNPQIVHFSGHGAGNKGLVFEDRHAISTHSRNLTGGAEPEEDVGLRLETDTGSISFVDAETLADLFRLFSDKVKCVLLNACYSEIQAEAISEHIPYVIGMNRSISDTAAIDFSVGFYDALGAGRSIEFAYELGCNAIRISGALEYTTPILKRNLELSEFSSLNSYDSPESASENLVSNLSSRNNRRLQKKIKDLEEVSEELRKKIKRLRKDYIVEADSEAKYKLEQRIEGYETQLQEIEEKLDSLGEQ